jgi:hypothetical protein
MSTARNHEREESPMANKSKTAFVTSLSAAVAAGVAWGLESGLGLPPEASASVGAGVVVALMGLFQRLGWVTLASVVLLSGCTPGAREQAKSAAHATGLALGERETVCLLVEQALKRAPGDSGLTLARSKCEDALATVQDIVDAASTPCDER